MAVSLDSIATLRLPVSLLTGTQIMPSVGSGYSQLTVKNGNPVDAVFKLVDVDSGKTLQFMYVRSNDNLAVYDLGTCPAIYALPSVSIGMLTIRSFVAMWRCLPLATPLSLWWSAKATRNIG
jgi:hypothetical protein